MKTRTYIYITAIFIFINMRCFAGVTVPYFQNFDSTEANGWTHYAISGTDDWQRGVPAKNYTKFAYTEPNVFATNLSGYADTSANRCLETPSFDFPPDEDFVLSFYHHYDLPFGECRIEYLLENTTNWLMLDQSKINKYNWYNSSDANTLDSVGFVTTSNGAFTYSSILLSDFKGKKNVKFRFRLKTLYVGQCDGWAIDNFSINRPFNNIKAVTTNDIVSTSKYDTTSLGIHAYSNYQCYLPQPLIDNVDIYLSLDSILDASDKYLGRQTFKVFSDPGTSYYGIYIPMPKDLYSRIYYIICKHNADSSVEETDYNDNIAYTILRIDTTFDVSEPYFDSFEGDTSFWSVYNQYQTSVGQNTAWHLGAANIPRTYGAHSGKNSWFTNKEGDVGMTLALESPYLYFKNAPNSTMCFWYRMYDLGTNSVNFSVNYTIDSKIFYYEVRQFHIRYPRDSKWDCKCEDLSALNDSRFSKVRFNLLSDPYTETYASFVDVDDVYIGPAAPDLLLERLYTLRTSQDIKTDTLHYRLFNGGLKTAGKSKTEFYWSNDSLLDNNDELLATIDEPLMTDTSFVDETMIFDKPANLTDGVYYIIYKVDAENQVDEYNENNNLGVITVNVSKEIKPPYYNDFESDTTSWTHVALYGTDSWLWATPNKNNLSHAFSGKKAFVTNPDGLAASGSRMDLFSPIFDLTGINSPVLSFDMVFQHNLNNQTDGAHANMTYSTDCGATWNILDTVSSSYANWYYYYEYEPINGFDYKRDVAIWYSLDTPIEKCFTSYELYASRDARSLNRRIIDISQLKNNKHIQFRLNLAITDTIQTEGIIFDNFSIAEKDIDLTILNTKNLYISPIAKKMTINIDVDNIGNYISNPCKIKIELPAKNDTIIPYKFPDVELPAIMPTQRKLLTLTFDLPDDLNKYYTMSYSLDYDNQNVESNKLNNQGFFDLGFDSFQEYPYIQGFNDLNLEGWAWYHDSSGWVNNDYFRFRNYKTPGDPYYSMVPTGIMATDEALTDLERIPVLFLESPNYDFSILDSLKYLKFDFICVGGGDAGGTMEYSTNGGNNWQPLTKALDPNAQNWFNSVAVPGIGNEPGWCHTDNYSKFNPARFDISFLQGKKDIKFRFKYKGNNYFWQDYNIWGMQIKNFNIDGFTVDLIALDSLKPVYPVYFHDGFKANYSIKNHSQKSVKPFRVKFWWSEDDILDANDKYIFTKDINYIGADSVLVSDVSFPFFDFPTQNKYYVFYYVDIDSVVIEPNKMNNLGSFVVDFTNTAVDKNKIENVLSIKLDNNSLIIKNDTELCGESIIKIIDLSGRTIQTFNYYLFYGLNELKISPTICPGFYLISIEQNGKIIYREKTILD